ncbi:MAG: hypothetical protein LBV47_00250 [Bacteroidales bacterium]|jgi:hypothetical protein|nr:hypothetical protein [Bacteroidales bacterium]
MYYGSTATPGKIFRIAPDELTEIYTERTPYTIRESGVPPDNHVPDALLPHGRIYPYTGGIKIYAGDVLLPDNIRMRKNWDFTDVKELGEYTLRITEEMIQNK